MATSGVIDTSTIAADTGAFSEITNWFGSLIGDFFWTMLYIILDLVYAIANQAAALIVYLLGSVPVPTQVSNLLSSYSLPPEVASLLVAAHAPEVFAAIAFFFSVRVIRMLVPFL